MYVNNDLNLEIYIKYCYSFFKDLVIKRKLIKLVYSNIMELLRVIFLEEVIYMLTFIEYKNWFLKYYYLINKNDITILEKF